MDRTRRKGEMEPMRRTQPRSSSAKYHPPAATAIHCGSFKVRLRRKSRTSAGKSKTDESEG